MKLLTNILWWIGLPVRVAAVLVLLIFLAIADPKTIKENARVAKCVLMGVEP